MLHTINLIWIFFVIHMFLSGTKCFYRVIEPIDVIYVKDIFLSFI